MEHILPALGMLLATALILAAAYFTTRWIALHGVSSLPGGRGDEKFRVLRQISLGRDAWVALVRVGERCLLLGVTPGGVTLLRELDAGEAEAWMGGKDPSSDAPPSFLEALQKNWPGKK